MQSQGTLRADFSVNASSVLRVDEQAILLSRIRATLPKNCVKLFQSLPIYTDNGQFCGELCDGELNDFQLLHLTSNQGLSFPVNTLSAVSDAVILKKNPPYPIGQRIPAPVALDIYAKNEPLVTRSALRFAIEKKSLIKLTLSLPPFHDENAKFV